MDGNRNFNRGNRPNQSFNQKLERSADKAFFERIREDYATEAENVVKKLNGADRGRIIVRTNQIRNVLDLINAVSEKMKLSTEDDIAPFKNEISYIRVKLAYIYGKAKNVRNDNGLIRDEDGVKDFIDKSKLIELILCIKDKNDYLVFARYVEALVAFHRYYGGKDN